MLEYFFTAYFVLLNSSYLLLNLIGAYSISRRQPTYQLSRLPMDYGRFEPAVSVLVPAYNEEQTIVSALQSVLQLEYHCYEVLVINDGSQDKTLQVLMAHFELQPMPLPAVEGLPTAEIKGFYRSRRYPFLRVIDKANGGKADALNAGANMARYPLVCCLDADSILQRDSLRDVVQPFIDGIDVVCSGGTVRVANGSSIRDGFLDTVGISSHPLALFQTVEYLRAFLFGREGWSPFNALLIVSGAFGVFDREVLLEVGGYRRQTIGEDMELTVRLHRFMREQKRPYRIQFLAEPVCWTEAPEDLATLRNQRIRWQRGLLESLWLNKTLLFSPRGGLAGNLAFPFFLIFEAVGPLIEVTAYLFMILGTLLGYVNVDSLLVFTVAAIGMGMTMSISALLMEEICFHMYPRTRQVMVLIAFALLENLGYRQLNSWWRLLGLYQWLTGQQQQWGVMKRKGNERP
jgi:cellulose synthase/poly-beta-1,6-N-acetylglucosamine synthase-like glycosyltransferase